MTRKSSWMPFYISVVLVICILIGVKAGKQFPYFLQDKNSLNTSDQTILEIIRYINGRYVDEVPAIDSAQNTIDKLLSTLDPHSSYIPAKDLKVFNEQLQGNFEGIGVEYIMNKDTIQIINAIPGGPSEQLGIGTGDKILTVEDSLVAGVNISSESIIRKLRGEKGTKVKVGILRGKQLLSFVITRDAISNQSVDAGFMLNEQTGYIKINRFAENTYREFMEKLDPMVEKQRMKDLVIDVRGNPGGFLQKAVDILNQFFKEKDKLLLYTEGRNSKKQSYQTNGQAFYDIGKIAVLIDEGSASASEILAGALQDWDRATIIGRRSFGKGLVQEQYPLNDGSALRLTIARYYTPSGRCIQKPYKGNAHYEEEVNERRNDGGQNPENAESDSLNVFSTASGKKVRSGGGISPDILVPLDPVFDNPIFIKLREQVVPFSINYVQRFKQQLNMGAEEFLSNPLNTTIYLEFLSSCQKVGVKLEPVVLQQGEAILKNLLKASLAKSLYRNETQYRILAQHDPVIKAALNNFQ